MKKYSLFHAPFMSFYSGDFYRDVGLNWSGTGFWVLFLLLLACAVPKAVRLQFSLRDFAEHTAPGFINQVPEIKIIDGEASCLAEQPYIIRIPGSGTPLAIVDTTGATISLEGSEAFLLVKKAGIEVRRNSRDTRILSLKDVDSFTLNQDLLNSVMGTVLRYGALLFALFALLGALIFRVLQALLYSALGAGIANLLEVNVPYGALLRLSVMAVMPVIIVTTIADVAGFGIPHPWLLGFGAAMGFLYLGIKSVYGGQPPAAAAQEAPAERQVP